MNGKLRVCRKCLPGQKNEEAFYEDLSRYIQRMDEELKVDQQTYETVSYTHLTLPTNSRV